MECVGGTVSGGGDREGGEDPGQVAEGGLGDRQASKAAGREAVD